MIFMIADKIGAGDKFTTFDVSYFDNILLLWLIYLSFQGSLCHFLSELKWRCCTMIFNVYIFLTVNGQTKYLIDFGSCKSSNWKMIFELQKYNAQILKQAFFIPYFLKFQLVTLIYSFFNKVFENGYYLL